MTVEDLASQVIDGYKITRDEASWLYRQPLDEICKYADEIREAFCGKSFDLCGIVNGKSGNCSEDCKFCAQSARNCTPAETYPLLPIDDIVKQAKDNKEQGIYRYSIVTSGKKLSDREVDVMCEAVKKIHEEVGVNVCASFGLLSKAQYQKLKDAGVRRIHNNIETSKDYFPKMCTTHKFEEKITAIKAAKAVGLEICSGGIFGLGEKAKDRIDMAMTLRDLDVKSIPMNMLNPIKGTPLQDSEVLGVEDMRRIVAIFRFILPDAAIRLAGGRGLLKDKGRACFKSGANAAISGDMLTTAGITVCRDLEMLSDLGFDTESAVLDI